MKVYLAARFSRKDELLGYRADLAEIGVEVTSRWLLGGHEFVGVPDEQIAPEHQARFAEDDLEDIRASDVVVCFTEPSGSGPARGGRHVEMGYSLGIGKPVLVVGHRENVFCWHASVVFCGDWASAVETLRGMSVLADTIAGEGQ